MEGMVRAGIGPWRVYTFGPGSCSDLTLHRRPARFSVRMCMALTGSMFQEIVEPLDGPSIQKEFLERRGGDVHHAALACGDMPWAKRVRAFEERGFRCIQSGVWMERVPRAYVGIEEATASVLEIQDIPKDSALSEFKEYDLVPPLAQGCREKPLGARSGMDFSSLLAPCDVGMRSHLWSGSSVVRRSLTPPSSGHYG